MAGDALVQVAPDSTGKKIDTSELAVGANTVERQRIVLADPADALGLARVTKAAATNADYGSVVRPVRAPLLGSYYWESGRLAVLAAAHASTAGFVWLINPVGSAVLVYVKKLIFTSTPVAVTAFPSAPRVTIERVTFTGVASGAVITPGKRDSNDAANVGSLRTASTGLTLTAGAVLGDFTVPAVLTAAGINPPVDQIFHDATRDDDDLVVLRAGEGLVFRQADAGTTSDTRIAIISGQWEER